VRRRGAVGFLLSASNALEIHIIEKGDRLAAMDAIVREMGNTKRFAIEELMVPRAAVPCPQLFIGHEGSREVSSTGPNRLDCPSFGRK
jgi:hypothetical protein